MWPRLTGLLPRLLGEVQRLSLGSLGLSELMTLQVGRLARPDPRVPGSTLRLNSSVAVPLASPLLFHVMDLSSFSTYQCGDSAAIARQPDLNPFRPSTGTCPGCLSPSLSPRGLQWRP